MAESRVKDGNYYVVQSFMVKDFKLKGLEKDVFAIIYGFSQAENQWFDGSLQYLADWTTSSKQGVLKALKLLQEKGLILKEENMLNGIKFVKYRSTQFNTPVKQSLIPIKQSLINNIYNNKEDNIDNNIYSEVIDYLNEVAGTNYKSTTGKTRTLIKARLNEKFTLTDFKTVINRKCACWKGTEFEKYLRPETLFGNKFESYLNERTTVNKIGSRDYDKETLDALFDSLDNVKL